MSLWLTAPAHAVTGGSAGVVGTQLIFVDDVVPLVPGTGCTPVSLIE